MATTKKMIVAAMILSGCLPAVCASDLASERSVQDVSDSFVVTATGFRRDLTSGDLVQAITIIGVGAQRIDGELALALKELSGASSARSDQPSVVAPNANAAFALGRTSKSVGLRGDSRTIVVRFRAQDGKKIRYTPKVLVMSD